MRVQLYAWSVGRAHAFSRCLGEDFWRAIVEGRWPTQHTCRRAVSSTLRRFRGGLRWDQLAWLRRRLRRRLRQLRRRFRWRLRRLRRRSRQLRRRLRRRLRGRRRRLRRWPRWRGGCSGRRRSRRHRRRPHSGRRRPLRAVTLGAQERVERRLSRRRPRGFGALARRAGIPLEAAFQQPEGYLQARGRARIDSGEASNYRAGGVVRCHHDVGERRDRRSQRLEELVP